MATHAQTGTSLLEVLKEKMRLTKEEMEKFKEDAEDMARKLQVEIMRREEVYNNTYIISSCFLLHNILQFSSLRHH